MDPNTEPQPRPDSGSTPPGHDFNIEDYTREEAEQSKTPIKDSNFQRIDEGTLWQRSVRFNITAKETKVPPPPPGDSNLDNIVRKASPDVTKGMGFAKENEPPPAPPPSITSEHGAHSNEPTGSAPLNVAEMALLKTVSKEDSCREERDDSREGRRIVSVDDIRGDSEVIYVGEKVEREDKTKDNKAPPPQSKYGASADDVIGMGQGGVID